MWGSRRPEPYGSTRFVKVRSSLFWRTGMQYTWSRAGRVHQVGGPRVIRQVEDPWGLMSLRRAELDQILMGNLPLGFALGCMILLALHGGMGILEHPKEPEPAHMVSIWRLPVVQFLLLFPRIRLLAHLCTGIAWCAQREADDPPRPRPLWIGRRSSQQTPCE